MTQLHDCYGNYLATVAMLDDQAQEVVFYGPAADLLGKRFVVYGDKALKLLLALAQQTLLDTGH